LQTASVVDSESDPRIHFFHSLPDYAALAAHRRRGARWRFSSSLLCGGVGGAAAAGVCCVIVLCVAASFLTEGSANDDGEVLLFYKFKKNK